MADGTGQDMTPAEEVDVLFPDQDLTIRNPETGEPVALTVREFRFREGLEVQALARPLIEALADAIEGEGQLAGDAINQALADHGDLWVDLVAWACDRDAGWVAALADADGEALSDAMWSANSGFFTRRVVATVAARKRKRSEAESGSQSPKSSMPSSGQDTDADTATSQTG